MVIFAVFSAGSLKAQDEDLVFDPRAYWHFACALYAQALQDEGRATVEFDQAARYDPTSATIHDRLASHYYVEGLEYKTEEELQKSIKLEPGNVQTRLLLANLFTSQDEYGKAQKEYDEILKMDPSNIEAQYYLAGVLANQNRIDDALLAYQKILDVNPKTAGVYYNMGLIYTRANQVSKAEEAFKKAIEIDPTLEQAYTSLGLVYELDQSPKMPSPLMRPSLKLIRTRPRPFWPWENFISIKKTTPKPWMPLKPTPSKIRKIRRFTITSVFVITV